MTPRPRRVRLDLAYDGTDFDGWQIQPGRRTVQATLESEIATVHGGSRAPVRGAGRTDAGVHARHQVADVVVATRLDDAGLLRALAARLPGDVRPVAVATVPDGFHARHDAVDKTYRYVLDLSPYGDPFRRRWSAHPPHGIDADRVRDALARLPGRRDFAGFAGAAGRVRTTVRHLTEAAYRSNGAIGVFSFTADGFLNHMVRNLVGTLLDVARGRVEPGRIDEVLDTRDRSRAGPTAPACGLHLHRVRYPGDAADGDEPWTDPSPLV